MTSEEYIQMLEKLMEHQDKQVGWLFFLIPLIVAIAGFFQWKLSSEDKKLLREEMNTKKAETDKILNHEISKLENDFKDENRKLERKMDDTKIELKDANRVLKQQLSDLEVKYDNKISEVIEQLSVRSGSNPNGYWMRYPDGNQICRHTLKVDREVFHERVSWVYPASFYDEDIAVFTESDDTDKIKINKIIKEKHQTIILLEKLASSSELGNTSINLMAYGRWRKEQVE